MQIRANGVGAVRVSIYFLSVISSSLILYFSSSNCFSSPVNFLNISLSLAVSSLNSTEASISFSASLISGGVKSFNSFPLIIWSVITLLTSLIHFASIIDFLYIDFQLLTIFQFQFSNV